MAPIKEMRENRSGHASNSHQDSKNGTPHRVESFGRSINREAKEQDQSSRRQDLSSKRSRKAVVPPDVPTVVQETVIIADLESGDVLSSYKKAKKKKKSKKKKNASSAYNVEVKELETRKHPEKEENESMTSTEHNFVTENTGLQRAQEEPAIRPLSPSSNRDSRVSS